LISTSSDFSAVPWFFCAALIGPIASLKLLHGEGERADGDQA
jgi:small ligand-binding sensory domain FIST